MLDANLIHRAYETISNAEKELAELLKRPVKVWFDYTSGKLSVQMIVSVVCTICNVSEAELMSQSKLEPLVFARYHCFNLMFRVLKMNKTEIGVFFNRNHATVINGLNQYDTMYETSKEFREQSKLIEKNLFLTVTSHEQ